MSAVTIQQMADRVASLMGERLNVRGNGLPEKVQNSGRLLPRRIRHAAQTLSQAATMAQNPRLLLQIDNEQVARAYDMCVRYLGRMNRWERWRLFLLRFAASATLIVIAVGLIFVAVLKARGDI